jgi:ABC-2 type transport system permease protein
MNYRAIRAIYLFEMARTWRTLLQSIVSPVVSTSLYFVVFGAAIGSRITEVEGVSYGTFIVPGLVMLSVLTQSIANASFGIYFPKFVGTIYEILSAPISYLEIVIGYVGAAATKSIILGLIILATAALFVPLHILHPWWMLTFLVLTAVTFSLFGFIIGIWADGFEKLQMIPMLIVTPLTFLGGSFYSVNMLPSGWRTITLLNPVVYLISGFRWSFYEIADVSVALSLGMTVGFLAICMALVWWIFRTVYRINNSHQPRRPVGATRTPARVVSGLRPRFSLRSIRATGSGAPVLRSRKSHHRGPATPSGRLVCAPGGVNDCGAQATGTNIGFRA